MDNSTAIRCNMMSTNNVETFNSIFKKDKKLSIITLIEHIPNKLQVSLHICTSKLTTMEEFFSRFLRWQKSLWSPWTSKRFLHKRMPSRGFQLTHLSITQLITLVCYIIFVIYDFNLIMMVNKFAVVHVQLIL